MVIRIPLSKAEEVEKLCEDKVVFSFVGARTEGQAKSWIDTFNETSWYQLVFADATINSLFIASLVESEGGGLKQKLLKKPH